MTGADDWFVRADWHPPPHVHALSTTRRGPGASEAPFHALNLGTHVGEAAAITERNRRRVIESLSLPSAPRWLRQVHGADVFDADRVATRDAVDPVADAAITRRPGVVLAILTADCLPLALAARDGSEVAVAHAGWRGLAAGVVEAALAAMRAPRGQIVAWLGPAIGPDAYEVGEEVRAALVAADPQAHVAFIPTRPGHWTCDLYAIARQRLARSGVIRAHGGNHCTSRERERFYSYRRDGVTGRMATLAWIAREP